MKTKLITALKTSAKALESGQFPYDWHEQTACNCGVVICAITGRAPINLLAKRDEELISGKTWRNFAGTVCPITGVPEHELFKQLFQAGFLPSDIHHLEFLSDKKILTRAGFKSMNHKKKEALILYLRAWAELLIEEGAADSVNSLPDIKPEIVAIK